MVIRKCRGLNEFLDGAPVTLKKNVFSIQSYASLFPDKAAAQRCIARMFRPDSPYLYFEPLFDGVFLQDAHILDDSVKVISFSREERPDDVVHFQVRFDMDVRLTETVENFDESSLRNPVCWEDVDFYSLARCLNNHLDQFYFVDHLKAVMFKNETEEESDRTFCLEFLHQMKSFSVSEHIKLLYTLLPSAEWLEKLGFWNAPEKFDFGKPFFFSGHGVTIYTYEVPNRTCTNNLILRNGLRMDEKLTKNLKKLYELIEENTVKMVYERRPYSILVDRASFTAKIRDVRTAQAMETHCFHVYNAVKNLHDYLQQEVLEKGENFLDHISRLVLERVKSDPLEYTESENPFIKKLATAWVNGSYYGE